MKYDFETVHPRRHVGSKKWDEMEQYGVDSPDVIPLSVADMEFVQIPEVLEGLKSYMERYPLGYANPTPEYKDAVCGWQRSQHGWEVKPETILCTPGIVNAFHGAVQTYTQPGDGVLMLSPTYYPMYNAVTANGRELVESFLVRKGSRYEIDFADFEAKAAQPNVKLMILCNPQNPTGRVFTEEELTKIGNICLKHGIFVCSDEIHGDIIMPGYHHIPFASLNDAFAKNCMVCVAATKTFNLAGLQTSAIIIPDEERRKAFKANQMKLEINPKCNILGYEASRIVYTQGQEWHRQCMEVIIRNAKTITDFCAKELPEVSITTLEGTYLLWMDLSAYGIECRELAELLKKEAWLFLDDGYIFGEAGEGFERWNLACPTRYIQAALPRLKKTLEAHRKS